MVVCTTFYFNLFVKYHSQFKTWGTIQVLRNGCKKRREKKTETQKGTELLKESPATRHKLCLLVCVLSLAKPRILVAVF